MNFSLLKNKIIEASEIAFAKVRKTHPNHSFYLFALYTTPMYEYLLPTCSSYEGFEQILKEYNRSLLDGSNNSKSSISHLKWSPCDSPLHLYGQEEFEMLQDDMEQLTEELDELFDSGDEDAEEYYLEKIEQCLIDALLELDQRGVFGNKEERENIMINILMGDQGIQDRLMLGKRLNSSKQLSNFMSDFNLK